MKKLILGTSDAWSMSRLAHQPSDPAYYIEDWLISKGVDETHLIVQSLHATCYSSIIQNYKIMLPNLVAECTAVSKFTGGGSIPTDEQQLYGCVISI